MKRSAADDEMEMSKKSRTDPPCQLALVDRDIHDAVTYEAFLYLTRSDILPNELIPGIIGTIELLFDFYVIKDAIHHGWEYMKHCQHLWPPASFECIGWGATYPLVYDGKEDVRVPVFIYETEVRRTGKRAPLLFFS